MLCCFHSRAPEQRIPLMALGPKTCLNTYICQNVVVFFFLCLPGWITEYSKLSNGFTSCLSPAKYAKQQKKIFYVERHRKETQMPVSDKGFTRSHF